MHCYIASLTVLDQVFLLPLLMCSRPARAEVTLAATWLWCLKAKQDQKGFTERSQFPSQWGCFQRNHGWRSRCLLSLLVLGWMGGLPSQCSLCHANIDISLSGGDQTCKDLFDIFLSSHHAQINRFIMIHLCMSPSWNYPCVCRECKLYFLIKQTTRLFRVQLEGTWFPGHVWRRQATTELVSVEFPQGEEMADKDALQQRQLLNTKQVWWWMWNRNLYRGKLVRLRDRSLWFSWIRGNLSSFRTAEK